GAPGKGGDAGTPDAGTSSAVDAGGPPPLQDDGGDPPAPAPDAGGPTQVVLALYTGSQDSYDALASFHESLTAVGEELYTLQNDGTITGSDPLGARAAANADGLQALATVSNYNPSIGDYDASLAHAAMVTYESAFVANALKLAQNGGFQGIDLDFEGVAYSKNVADDRAAYSSLAHDLATALHAAGLQLVLSVPRKTADNASDTWSYPYDFAGLAADADALLYMTYDENGPWDQPGPVAGADWVKSCLTYATSVVSPAKLLLGLPNYGYDWDISASNFGAQKYVGTQVAWKDIPALLAKPGVTSVWDAPTSSPHFAYVATDGHAHEVWYENVQSIDAKVSLGASFGVGGIAVSALGNEDASFWQAALSAP
ncbi:MAG TPA: glycosyl hydrolase family 18 protein, partial [Polyangiaceae bacterium]